MTDFSIDFVVKELLDFLPHVLRWHTLVFAACAFAQYRRVVPVLTNPQATLPDLPDVIATHQHEHLRQTVCYIAALARRGLSDAKLLAELLPT